MPTAGVATGVGPRRDHVEGGLCRLGSYEAQDVGDTNLLKNLQAPQTLVLKIGAQVHKETVHSVLVVCWGEHCR